MLVFLAARRQPSSFAPEDTAVFLAGGALLCGLVSLIFLGRVLSLRARRRHHAAIPRVAIADQREGLVQIEGRVVALQETEEHPLTGEQAVIHRYLAQERHGHGKRKGWTTLAEGKYLTPFLVDDGSALAVVHPHWGGLELEELAFSRNEFGLGMPVEGLDPFRRFEAIDRDRPRRVSGSSLEVGEQVRVIGLARPLGPEDAEAQAAGASLALERPSGDEPLLVTDRSHAEEEQTLGRQAFLAGLLCALTALLGLVCGALALQLARG